MSIIFYTDRDFLRCFLLLNTAFLSGSQSPFWNHSRLHESFLISHGGNSSISSALGQTYLARKADYDYGMIMIVTVIMMSGPLSRDLTKWSINEKANRKTRDDKTISVHESLLSSGFREVLPKKVLWGLKKNLQAKIAKEGRKAQWWKWF